VFCLAALLLASVLVLNEVMIRPATGGSEWIEIYNSSDQPVSVGGLSFEDSRGRPARVPLAAPQVEAKGYRLLAANVPKVLAAYPSLDPARVLALEGAWPTLNDSDGEQGFADRVLIRDPSGAGLDSLTYLAAWLGAAGTSLERVDAGTSSTLASNWSPCSADSGATPLARNSLSLTEGEEEQGTLVVPEVPMNPDAGGSPPAIGWHLEEPGLVTIEMFDLAGRSVRLLKPLEPGAPVGRVVWDGKDDSGTPVPAGVYLVLLEARYEDEVEPRRWRRPLVIARSAR